jgi:2'-5' RNA ligase
VPSLSVCLLLDDTAEAAVRRLWRQLEEDGVTTLATYTHGRHVPHVTLAHVGTAEVGDVREALAGLGPTKPVPVVFAALGAFTRSRCSLVPTPSVELLAAGRYYRPGSWLPHLTLGPRLPVDRLTTLARRVFEVLPLEATLGRAAVVDTTVGAVYPLP